MKDKFRQNFRIAFPAALLTVAVLIFEGFLLEASNSNFGSTSVDLVQILPYLLVISLAIIGFSAFAVLVTGICQRERLVSITMSSISWVLHG